MSSRKVRIISLSSLGGLLLLVAFGLWILLISFQRDPATASEAEGLNIVTTVGMLSDIVHAVTGDSASVTQIIGSGVDPHLYTPTRSDIGTFMNSDIIVYVGLYLEGQLEPAIAQLEKKGHEVFSAESMLTEESLLPDESFHFDPHVWMDVALWSKVTEAFAAFMTERSPEKAELYAQNSADYVASLAELDEYVRSTSSTVPVDQRIIITAHDAFRYFGQSYEYEVIGIQGISTESEASIRKINRLVELIVSREIRAIFVESSVPEKYVRALVEGARAQGHSVNVGGSLFSDAMGMPGTYEGSYIGMIDHNVTTIVRALGGVAPTLGFNGKLRALAEK